MKRTFLIISIFCSFIVKAQNSTEEKMTPQMTEVWNPEVIVITSGQQSQDAPSDAISLFNGTKESLTQNWNNINGDNPQWIVESNTLTVLTGSGNIQTKEAFEDVQLHIEWRTPAEILNDGQNRGNSGIFFQGRYNLYKWTSWFNLQTICAFGQCL
jgi:hypothetical protein